MNFLFSTTLKACWSSITQVITASFRSNFSFAGQGSAHLYFKVVCFQTFGITIQCLLKRWRSILEFPDLTENANPHFLHTGTPG